MFWDWIYRITHWRQIRDDMREMDEMLEHQRLMTADLNRRIQNAFTPEEWRVTEDRCLRKLEEMGIDVSDLRGRSR